MGIRDVDYQNYVADKESSEETPLSYESWKTSLEGDGDGEKSNTDEYLSTASEILPSLAYLSYQ